MHLTLHLTTDCTMRCSYCYSPPLPGEAMSARTATEALEFVLRQGGERAGILFFGGEPLLKKDVIISTVHYGRELERRGGFTFHFRVTTNGLLLDGEFLEFARQARMQIALSIDGIKAAHDLHRKDIRGRGTYEQVQQKARLLLRSHPLAQALMTVTPETVCHYAASVEDLLEQGFRYLVTTLDYGSHWEERHLEELQEEYEKCAVLYKKLTVEEKKFSLTPFEMKLAARIQGGTGCGHTCHLGFGQLSVAPDGSLYPCIQFVRDGTSLRDFAIGSVRAGVDEARRQKLFLLSRSEPEACSQCALSSRCEHRCGCVNFFTTGTVNGVSSLLCRTEQMLIPIVDRLGEELYALKAPMFLQKHYNPAYPVLSMLEDLGV